MNFLDKVIEYFSSYDIKNLPQDIIGFVAVMVLVIFVLGYAAKHHGGWYAGIVVVVIIIVAALTALGAIKDAYILYVVTASILICTVVLFGGEMRRDLYKMAIKQVGDTDESFSLTLDEKMNAISRIVKSCQSLSKSDTGALIVICNNSISDQIADSGTSMNADLTSELIETVFYPKCPLHDGAMLVTGNKILAAGCYLPLTQRPNLSKELGTRHRAAIGVTEADPTVTAVVVSEESGIISVMHDGLYKRYMDAESLTQALKSAYGIPSTIDFWSDKKDLRGQRKEDE